MNNDSNSRRFCSYNGCSSDRLFTLGGAISFFSFPKDTERCSIWITNSGREEFRYLTPRELQEKRLCELHFAPAMFSNEFKTKLRKGAIPMGWKNSSPELIQIDDDDELCEGEEIESVIVNGTAAHEMNDENENESTTLNNSILSAVLTNGQTSKDLNGEKNPDPKPNPLGVVSNNNEPKSCVESQPITTVTKNTSTVEENCKSTADKSSSKSDMTSKKRTKFHNLPPQTTQGEFYYQQCPSAEETNNSYPEPPDGEMPLFVQQNSVVSMADEIANSDASEPPAKRRKRDKDSDDLSEQMRDAMKHLRNITELLTTNEDEFELFGKSVALQLKKMSLCTALTVQAKIQNLLSQHRINDIKKQEQSKPDDVDNTEVKNSNEDEPEEQPEEGNSETPNSPQLSLDCASEVSDNEVG